MGNADPRSRAQIEGFASRARRGGESMGGSKPNAQPDASPRSARAAGRPTRLADGAFLRDVLAGLSATPRSLPSRWFYDARGSRLFQWISRLDAYYPTRVEREILERHGDALASRFAGAPCTVVDLGAGDGHKSQLVLRALLARCTAVTYSPVDVSADALAEAAGRVREHLPAVRIVPVHAEWEDALRRVAGRNPMGPQLVLFLGSSIGNLERADAAALLGRLRRALRPGDHALVGFDLVKPLPVLRRAYDDPQGVTREFNLNLLARINRELGADFDLAGFRHVASWDPGRPAMESWLESTRRQLVHVDGRVFAFRAGERIHTEISCKYTDAQVAAFAREAGFVEVARLEDPRRWFVDALWRVGG
jgi:dimethylhistidine N-methyltransferase